MRLKQVAERLRNRDVLTSIAIGLGAIGLGAAIAAEEPIGTDIKSPVPVIDIATTQVYAEPSIGDQLGGVMMISGGVIVSSASRNRKSREVA